MTGILEKRTPFGQILCHAKKDARYSRSPLTARDPSSQCSLHLPPTAGYESEVSDRIKRTRYMVNDTIKQAHQSSVTNLQPRSIYSYNHSHAYIHLSVIMALLTHSKLAFLNCSLNSLSSALVRRN